ncbi:C2 domain-containing protein [Ceratobasidium sp. AG-Ba]|nr:C2 domain-containing protein [Ceratobasidium sp. AG-Ba]
MDSKRIPKEPFSAANPVPKVAHLFRNVVDPQSATNSKAKKLVSGRKDQKMEQEKIEDAVNRMARGQTLHVSDPVTGEDITIRNADEDPDTERDTINFLDQPLPKPNWPAHGEHVRSLFTQTLLGICTSYILLPLSAHAFFNALPDLPVVGPPRTWHLGSISLAPGSFAFWLASLALPSLISYVLVFRLHADSTNDFEAHVWDAERRRGVTSVDVPEHSDDSGSGKDKALEESAEWTNSLLKELWPRIDPDLFVSVVDMLEDVMQASMPSIVNSIRVSDIGQGGVAPRITGIRALPSRKDENGAEEKDHVNVELSFAYHALPSGSSASSKAGNAHIVVDFFVGARGFFGVQVPVWVEISGAIGTARARLEIMPGPPFVKTAVVTLLGLPRISISVVPLHQHFTNIMNLPLISTFVSNSLNTAVAEYVAPKSLKLDVQRLISGDDVKRDTDAIGIIVVTIHRAMGLKGADLDGGSVDPYVTLAFARLGRPLFSTRIISGRDPIWEESTVILVGPDATGVREKLSFQIWDSDRISADDVLGTVEIDIATLIKNKNRSSRRIEPVQGEKGTLEFTVGFYEKEAPNPAFRAAKWKKSIAENQDGNKNNNKPPDLSPDSTSDERSADDDEYIRPDNALNDLEAAVMTCAPDPELPSGIISIQIHEMRNIGFKLTKGTKARGRGPGDEDDMEEEEGEGLPSTYCTVLVNDQRVYKTRVKPLTATPFFNAGEPTKARLPPNILGFSVGTLQVHKIKVNPDEDHSQFAQAQIRARTIADTEKVSRKAAEEQEDGSVEWSPDSDDGLQLPVQKRFGTALVLEFKVRRTLDIGPQKQVGLAVLWLRDLVDGERTTTRVALWDADNDSSTYLSQNYIPPLSDSNSSAQTDSHDAKQIGFVELDVTAIAGLTEAHKKVLDGSDPQKKQSWEEYEAQDASGARAEVGLGANGEEGVQAPKGQNFTVEESQAKEGQKRQSDDEWSDAHNSYTETEEAEGTGDESDGRGRRGPVQMFKEWKEHEHELHREHRGLMQTKPMRTANWLKDGVKKGGHKIQERFSQHSREPEVETEV